jgi:hypothetical protein
VTWRVEMEERSGGALRTSQARNCARSERAVPIVLARLLVAERMCPVEHCAEEWKVVTAVTVHGR